MATILLKEEQRYRDPFIFFLLSIPLVVFVTLFVQTYLLHTTQTNLPIAFFLLTFVVLGGALWYFLHLRLKISVSDKGIKFRYGPWFAQKRRIRWDEVESYEFVQTPPTARWTGADLHFETQEGLFSLCGHNGLRITTKQGEKLFFGSRELLSRREEIGALIKSKLQ